MKKLLFFIAALIICHTTIGQVILNESFDGTTFPPTGWTNLQVSGSGTTSTWARVTAGTYPVCTTHSGAGMASYNCYNYSSGKAAILASPSIDLTVVGANTATLSFWMYRDNAYSSTYDSLDVYMSNSLLITGATHLGKINRSRSLSPVETADGWYKYSFDIPSSYNGATNYLVLKATSLYGNDIYIDDVNIKIAAANDAGIISIDGPASYFIAGSENVTATIRDFGTANLTTANIAWKVNGITQTPVAWTGILATGDTDGPILLGNFDFAPGLNTIKVWSENPNGALDGDNTNDTITKVVFAQGFATLPFSEDFEATWMNKLGTRDVPTGFWQNTPVTGNNSWRRDDDGTAGGWSSSTSGAYSPAGANGTSHSARFHTWSAVTSATGIFDLYLDFSTLGTKILKFYYINPTGSDSLDVYISHDGGATFNFLQQYQTSASWALQQLTLGSATDANTIVRFKATSDYGNDDYGLDQVEVSIMQPNDAGIISIDAPNSTVSGVTPVDVTIKNYGYIALTTATIDWSVNGVLQTPYSYVNVSGLATNLTDGSLNLGSYNFATMGSYIIKAWSSNPNSAIDGNSANDTASMVVFMQGYAPVPFAENFDSTWINKNGTRDVPSLYWDNNPSTGNDSWRRNDDGATASWSSTSGSYSPAGSNGTIHSARFHSWSASYASKGMLDLYLDFTTPGTKVLKFDYINTSGGDSLDVYISHDGGLTFAFLQEFTTSAAWTGQQMTLGTANDATTVIRFKTTSDGGASDIGLDNVKISILQPNDAGIASIDTPVSPVSGVTPVSVTIENFGTVNLTSAAINWAVNGVAQTPFSYTNGPGLAINVTDGPIVIGSYDFNTAGYYTIKSWTSLPNGVADGDATNDTTIKVVFKQGYASLPFSEGFEGTWINKNDIHDVPSLYWMNTPAIGRSSWRREDDGLTAGWSYLGLGSYIPSGANGSLHSADFHSYGALNGTTGTLDLYLDFTTAGQKGLTFDYVNYSGNDSLDVYISHDAGATFAFLQELYTAPDWTTFQTELGTATDAQTIVRFKATSDYGNDDIGLDNVAVSTPADVNLGPDIAFCSGESVTLDASPLMPPDPMEYTLTYSWSTLHNTNVIATTAAITVDSAATYIVAVNNGFGFITRDTIVLTTNTTPLVALGPDVTACNSYTIDAGNNSGDTYSWSTGETTQTITVTTTGTYSVTVTNSLGCSASDDIQITIVLPPTVALGPDVSACNSYTLDAGAGYASYNWSTGETTQTINVTLTDTFWVEVANSFGCIARDTIHVLISPNPVVTLGPDVAACGSYILDAGAGQDSYLWSDGENTQTITVTSSNIFTVTVTNSAACVATDDINITIIPLPTVNAGLNQSLCYLDTLHLTDAFATGYDSLLWTSNGDGHFNDSTLLHPYYIAGVTDTANGSVQLSLTVYAYCDTLSSVMTYQITHNSFAFAGTDTTICYGANIQLEATGGTSYLWSPALGLSDNTIANPIASPASTTTYTVVVTGSCGTASDAITVSVHHVTPVSLGPNINLCTDTFALLDAGVGYDSYLWSTSAITQTINADTTGQYIVTVTDSTGCSAIGSVNVNYYTPPVVHVTGDTMVCFGAYATLNADAGFASYLWKGTIVGTDVFHATTTGNYWVNVTDLHGCSSNSDTLHTDIFNLNDINLGPDVTIHLTEYVILDATHGYDHYSWSLGANTQMLTVYGTDLGIGYHIISVSAWKDEGCLSTDSITIHVINNTGIDEVADGGNFSIYPNPANDYTTVIVPASWSSSDLIVNLTDIAGRSIRKMNISNASSIKIDLAGIAPGMYQVVISRGAEQSNIKLIVQ